MELWIAILGLAIGLPAIFLYNRLVAERNLARQGFADIDVQLKRRADLVPPLVEAVRAYAAYEKAVLTAVTEVRSAALSAPGTEERFSQERVLGEYLKKLIALQEAYPELKADASFRDLSAKLVEVEDQLQYARRFYNGAVKEYVTRLESFPSGIVARLFGFQPMPFFATADRETIAVDL
jgi:LemA protein